MKLPKFVTLQFLLMCMYVGSYFEQLPVKYCTFIAVFFHSVDTCFD